MGDDRTHYSVDMGTCVCLGGMLAVFGGQEEKEAEISSKSSVIGTNYG